MAKKPKVLPSIEWLEPRVRAMRVVSLLCYFGLVGLLCVYYLMVADLHGARPWVILLIELVPLLLLAPGMIIGSARGHSWMCFVVNLYFIKGAPRTDSCSACWRWARAWRCFVRRCCMCGGGFS